MLDPQTLEKFKETCFSGRYNLLLGAGISLDSRDRNGQAVVGGERLKELLCKLKGVRETTPLSKVSPLLTDSERKQHLTDRYFGCRPGPTVFKLTGFVWKHAFTLNIDDALEAAYQASPNRKQNPIPINYDSLYETFSSRYELPIIHLHGFVRQPDKEYVFSLAQYANVTRGLNPWMHVLSQMLGSEAFIIAGTSLSEPDLEFYLSSRTPTSPRTDRGPSILVEPYPDAVTENECKRHGLVLVKASLLDFLTWIEKELGPPPGLDKLTLPTLEMLFSPVPDKLRQIAFFSSFDFVSQVEPLSAAKSGLSSFFYGRPPSWQDLASSVDIPLDDELRIGNNVRAVLDSQSESRSLLVALSEPGFGKTTDIRRVAYDLAREGRIVFSLRAHASIDVEHALACLKCVQKPYVLVIDGVADHAQAIRDILEAGELEEPFIIVGAERDYRYDHLDRVLGDLNVEYVDLTPWPFEKYLELIERYRRNGLLGSEAAIKDPRRFAERLQSDSAAVAVCRILNDFKPLDTIVKSIWNDASEGARRSYLIAALAHYCHPVGVQFSILQTAQSNPELEQQVSQVHPLPICYSADNDDYVLPLNAMVADRVLTLIGRNKRDILLEAFTKLGNALAPYVNRRAIINQTPEARLAGRLFDADRVVRPLLEDMAESLYVNVKESWEWNSRYWEQRALLIQNNDLNTALQYARHAVAIERHPFPLTTLARMLIRKMEVEPSGRDFLFNEAFDQLSAALGIEMERSRRVGPHAFFTVFQGALKFVNLGGTLSNRQRQDLQTWINDARYRFARDTKVQSACDQLEIKMKAAN